MFGGALETPANNEALDDPEEAEPKIEDAGANCCDAISGFVVVEDAVLGGNIDTGGGLELANGGIGVVVTGV